MFNSQRGSTATIGIVVVVIFLAGAIYFFSQNKDKDEAPVVIDQETSDAMMMQELSDDSKMMEIDDDTMAMMHTMPYDYSGNLFDVTNGEVVRGINTGGNASGVAQAAYIVNSESDPAYYMTATFDNLPDPVGTDFYEGWIVRKSPFDVISTGIVEKTDGVYVNNYASEQDLTDHDFYVLTLEPDDGDPAPADHIVEGVMSKVGGTMMHDNDGGDDSVLSDPLPQTDPVAVPAEYVDYSASGFAAASDRKRVIFFHAAWCPFCIATDVAIRANLEDIPDDVIIFKANYDEENDLKDQYGITYQDSFVLLDENGASLDTWTGGGLNGILSRVQ